MTSESGHWEEIREQFGEAYRAYQRQVPMFIPRWGRWRQLAAASRDGSDDAAA